MWYDYAEFLVKLIPIILFVITITHGNWRERKAKKERRGLWIGTLRLDQTIADCLDELKKYTSLHGKGSSYVPYVSASIGYVASIWIIEPSQQTSLEAFNSMLAFNIFLVFPVIALMFYIDFLRSHNYNLFSHSKYVVGAMYSLFWIALVGNGFILITGGSALVDYPQDFFGNYADILMTSLLSYFFLFICYMISKNNFDYYKESLSEQLNAKYLKKYPVIKIKTRDDDLVGVIQDIFNENLALILMQSKSCAAAVEWQNISTLTICSGNLRIENSSNSDTESQTTNS